MDRTLQPETEPGIATAEHGQVTLDGPDGVAVAMTPEAARETGRRLIEAAQVAATQIPAGDEGDDTENDDTEGDDTGGDDGGD